MTGAEMSPASIPRFKLNDGTSYMPVIGLGCWMGRVGEGVHVIQMVKKALEIGYRHIDTASDEESVGKAIRESNIPRSEIFLTTKLAGEDHGRVSQALDQSLRKLGLDYVDLYLMHWPQALREDGTAYAPHESPTFVETWRDMETLLDTGKVRSIGVSNFSIKTLDELLAHAQVVPAVNQVEAHPCLPQHELLVFCRERGIQMTAYSPVGKHQFAEHSIIRRIAERRGTSAARVMVSWGVLRGVAVIPKTEKEERLKENFGLVELESQDVKELDGLHNEPGMHRSVCGFHSSERGGSCFGWTYNELGWDMVVGGRMRHN
ncbi:hypothetical protein AMATHDRAFT_77044 [Amanita thiersii Skay4041]|uniref:NADP-dependent oxidoreductase domain-containing protein n=1 Tax=Amanita thiersii Skay4041 TaxID=703135 RepID=A0A2A9NJ74_9AGAR|nr:hypothetical protein AMATHDRAFT_77044 [Amanita thiersii Skay4041]